MGKGLDAALVVMVMGRDRFRRRAPTMLLRSRGR